MAKDISAIARAAYHAYVTKDRAALEALIANDFRFTSPLDNGLTRESYFAICWPNSANMVVVDFKHIAVKDERAFVTYECHLNGAKRFRNTELFTVIDGKVVDVEVYFGWSLPHEATDGKFLAAK